MSEQSNAPRFVQVTEDDDDNRRTLVAVQRIKTIRSYPEPDFDGGCLLDIEGMEDSISVGEPIDTIISRIREVGGVVSSYGEGEK